MCMYVCLHTYTHTHTQYVHSPQILRAGSQPLEGGLQGVGDLKTPSQFVQEQFEVVFVCVCVCCIHTHTHTLYMNMYTHISACA
jgi:hypothetical protein